MTRIILFLITCMLCTVAFSQVNIKTQGTVLADTLYQQFLTPPNASRPRVWWHWMNGNINKNGIRKDLLWMHRAGIGGFQNFDASMETPQVVEKRLIYMTPEWKDAFRYTTTLADSLKLEMAIAASPGYSESGGPWVKPEDGMKKIVWVEKFVKGGTTKIKLPPPVGITGPIQSLSMNDFVQHSELGMGEVKVELPTLYKDVAILAYRLPSGEMTMAELSPQVTSSAGNFTMEQLTDGDLSKTSLLPRDSVSGYAWIQFNFKTPTTIQAITAVGGGDRGPFGLLGELKDTRILEASDDGQNFKFITFIPANHVLQQTLAITPTTAKFFRVRFKNLPPRKKFGTIEGSAIPKPPAGIAIAELILHTNARIHWAENKAAFSPARLDRKMTILSGEPLPLTDIVDITSKLNPDGSLNWTAPEGRWNIIRFGYSLIGKTNHPAPQEATGLEVDKLDPDAIKRYFTNYLDQYKDAACGLMGTKGGLQYIITDSWEAGAQNWTTNMPAEFKKRRGYDMLPWLPVISGRIIKSAEASEKFLFDFRKTISEMTAEYHYDGLTKILESYGMKRYTESHEGGRAMIADGMDVKRSAAIPMSAMWTPNVIANKNNVKKHEADIRESASVAHIYGQNLVAAESFTAYAFPANAWSYYPENLKPVADLELANGLNRFVIHTSVHQPVDDKIPGLGLGPFGQWFTRHETWSENAKAWTDYLSRSCFMLQQGKFVADVLVYYGEDTNITAIYYEKLPNVPEGYNFDFINSDALVNLLTVKDGNLVTPSGMSYRMLILDSTAVRLPVQVLTKIRDLVKAGATISGVKPTSTPSLSDDTNVFTSLVNEVWNAGNKNVLTGKTISEVLTSLNIPVDFSYTKPEESTKLLFVHRTLVDREIYWVSNKNNRSETIEASFRVSGKVPEVWHPETGQTEAVSYTIKNGKTNVMLNLTPADALFVVFRDNAKSDSVVLRKPIENSVSTLTGEWDLSFQPNRGAPDKIKITDLKSWTTSVNAGIKYFSGTATYSKQVNAPKQWFKKGQQMILELGEVKNLAEVIVNGQSLGVLWKNPFRIDITNALKPGINNLEIKVTNLWVNRLVGDQQPGETKKFTYTTQAFYSASSIPLPSGLMGPVQILSMKNQDSSEKIK